MTDPSQSTFPRWEPLGKHHDRAAFSCPKHREFETYLQQLATQQAKRYIAATTVMLIENDTRVDGYYTLSSTRLDLGELPEELAKKFPRYAEGIPTTLIGRLAVDQKFLGQGWGRRLLVDALKRAHRATEQVASAFVIVRAIDDDAVKFYSKYGFQPFPSNSSRLFLPMATVAKLNGSIR